MLCTGRRAQTSGKSEPLHKICAENEIDGLARAASKSVRSGATGGTPVVGIGKAGCRRAAPGKEAAGRFGTQRLAATGHGAALAAPPRHGRADETAPVVADVDRCRERRSLTLPGLTGEVGVIRSSRTACKMESDGHGRTYAVAVRAPAFMPGFFVFAEGRAPSEASRRVPKQHLA